MDKKPSLAAIIASKAKNDKSEETGEKDPLVVMAEELGGCLKSEDKDGAAKALKNIFKYMKNQED